MKSIRACLCAALAACAATPPPTAPAPPSQPSESADGEYSGTSTRFQAERRACPHPGLVHFDVISHAFQYRWDASTYVDATIADGGTVTGSADRITLSGRQSGPKIEGDVTNGDCALHFTVTKRP